MIVGCLWLKIYIRESTSLKAKRMVTKSLKDRLRNRFNVSVSEVGGLRSRQLCELGVTTCAGEKRFVESVLSQVVEMVRSNWPTQLVDHRSEVFSE